MDVGQTGAEIKIALEEMLEGIQIVSRDWVYLYVNKAAGLHGRKSPQELMNKSMLECYPGIEKSPMFRDMEYVMQSGHARQIENEFQYEDGRKCWFQLYFEPYQNGILIRSIDITDKKRIEDQLRHAQKMDAIGRLAGGVAHDFNNKLAIMLVYVEMTQRLLKNKNPTAESYLENIHKAVSQSSSLTKQLLAFSRKQVLDLKVINLNALLADTIPSFQKLLTESIQIKTICSDSLHNIKVDPSQLEEVLLNLIINARDVMPDGGSITIETSNVILDRDYAEEHIDVTPGPYTLLSITDTGCGMDKKTLSQIFEPFFTTKEPGRGTGLGLAMVHGFVNQSNGHIWAYSEPQIGTVFKIYLPAHFEGVVQTFEKPVDVDDYTGNEMVLIAEDDPLLRQAYEAALSSAGYRVISVKDGREGEKMIREQGAKINMLLTDVVLPKMMGKPLADFAKSQHPDIKIVYVSGYTENSIVHHGVLDTESVLIQKPVSIHNLLKTIRQVFDGHVRKGVF